MALAAALFFAVAVVAVTALSRVLIALNAVVEGTLAEEVKAAEAASFRDAGSTALLSFARSALWMLLLPNVDPAPTTEFLSERRAGRRELRVLARLLSIAASWAVSDCFSSAGSAWVAVPFVFSSALRVDGEWEDASPWREWWWWWRW